MRAGAAPSGTEPAAVSVRAAIRKSSMPVIQTSATKAPTGPITSGFGTMPKAPAKEAVDAALPRTMASDASIAAMPEAKMA